MPRSYSLDRQQTLFDDPRPPGGGTFDRRHLSAHAGRRWPPSGALGNRTMMTVAGKPTPAPSAAEPSQLAQIRRGMARRRANA